MRAHADPQAYGESVIINLIRTPVPHAQLGEEACHAEALGVPAHLVVARPFEAAEAEVKRRVLRSLADRTNPPSNIAFVRTWEPLPPASEPVPVTLAGDAPRKRQPRGAKR